MPRKPDRVRIEGPRGSFSRFNSINITNDITAPSEASFDVGDDGSWAELADILKHGTRFRVFLNDRLRMTGRVHVRQSPTSTGGGAVIQVTIRTKLSDARFASADPRTRVENTSIGDFIYALYKPLGYERDAFVFAANVERNVMTGVGAKGIVAPADLEPIKQDQAKVNPPETIFDAAARHLKRYGLMHWDTPNGQIYVGRPDDQQQPIYDLRLRRGSAGRGNNLASAQRVQDWSDAPTTVTVFGTRNGKDLFNAPLRGGAGNIDIIDAGFYRPVLIQNESAKNQAQVDSQAKRERSARSKKLDAWECAVDGWSYWDGQKQIPWGTNTTANLSVDTAGGAQGRYYLQKVAVSLTPGGGQTASLSLVAPGTWEI
jgi:prophage tail gpP-like protein